MDSPYKPGFGARPAVLVGREAQLARAEVVLTRVENSGEAAAASVVFTGARGLGKTVTLGVIGDRARARGFVVATVTLDRISDNVQMLAAAIAEAIAPLHSTTSSTMWARVHDRLSALSIEVNAGVVKIVSESPGHAGVSTPTVQRQVLASLLQSAAKGAAEKDRRGLVVLLDEVQEAPMDQLVVLANAIQDTSKTEKTPLAIFAAGLPQTPELVMEAASFTERFDFRTLGRLDHDTAERALIEPALALGVRWAPDAVELALQDAGGSPYLIQYIGDETWAWISAKPGCTIEPAQVEAAIIQVRDSLAGGMYRGRWAKATPAEKAVIVAVAETGDRGGVATTRDVSTALGVQTRQWSMARQSLIDKGIVETAGRGRLRFTMPGFASFAAAQAGDTGSEDDRAALPPARTAHQPVRRTELPPSPPTPRPQR